jgi:hypothetical protein
VVFAGNEEDGPCFNFLKRKLTERGVSVCENSPFMWRNYK